MAKSFIAKFLVDVGSKGLGKTKADVDALGKGIQNVSIAHASADKAAHSHFDTQAKGIIGTANSSKSFSKLAQTMNSGSGVVGAYATLAANIFTVTAAFNALRGAAQADQVLRGLEASGTRAGQTLLMTAKSLKEVTGNALSMEQAMRSTAQITAAGFDSTAVERLGRAARDTSFALGRNMQDSLDRLTRGVVKLEPELLDELGIMTKLGESNAAYARQLGKSESQLSNFERRQGFMNAVLAEAELKFGGLSDAAGNSTSYDKLAATFSDLTNTTLKFINGAVIPLIGFLGASPLGLAGLAVLFAGTIRGQLLPGLANLTENAKKSAEQLKEVAKQSAAAIADQSPRATTKIGNKIYDSLNEKISAGTATLQNYQSALNLSTESLKKYESQLLSAEKAKVRNTDRINKITEEIELHTTYQQRLKEVIATEIHSAAQTQASAAIGAVANNKLITSWQLLRVSVANYNTSLKITQTSTTATAGAMTLLRTVSFATAAGIRVLGAALLNAIPLLGQILFVVGLVTMALDAMKSDKQKELEERFKSLSEVTSTVGDKMKELNRVLESQGSLALRTEKAISIQANAMNEIIEQYRKYTSAIEDNDKAQRKNSGIAGFFNDGSDRATASNALKIRQDSKALEVFAKDFQGVATYNIAGVTQETKALIKAFDAALQVNRPLVNEVVKLHGGYEALASASKSVRAAKMADIMEEIARRTGPAAQQVEALATALRDANTSAADFIKGLIPSTPYDQMVTRLSAVTNSINEIKDATAAGQQTTEDWARILTGLGPSLMSLLPADTAKSVRELNEASATIQSLSAIASEDRSAAQNVELESAKKILATEQSTLNNLSEQLFVLEDVYQEAQKTERLNKSLITLEQARLGIHQKDYALTSQGVAARIDAENKIKDLNAATLQAQKSLIDAALAQQKLKLDQLKIEAKITEEISKQGREQLRINVETARAALDAARAEENRLNAVTTRQVTRAGARGDVSVSVTGRTGTAAEIAAATQARKTLEEEFTSVQKLSNAYSVYESQLDQIAALEQASESVATSIAAILETKTTNAERAAAIAEKEAELQVETRNSLHAQLSIISEITSSYERQRTLILGTQDSLGEQLKIIRAQREESRRTIDNVSQNRIETLKAQRATADARRAGNASDKATLDFYDQQIKLAEQQRDLELNRLNVLGQTQELELVIFDARREGLDWQQQSLSYLQKALDAEKQLASAVREQVELRSRIDLRRRGLEQSDQGKEALEIRVAEENYRLAVSEFELKKTLIELEYTLLEAQKTQLFEELAARRDVLASRNVGGIFDNRIDQLTVTLERLARVDTGNIVDTLVRAAEIELSNAKDRVDLAVLGQPRGHNQIIATMEGIADRQEARASARAAVTEQRAAAAERVVRPVQLAPAAVDAVIDPLIASNSTLELAIRDWISAINGILTTSPTTTAVTARDAITGVGGALQGRGYRVSEHPEFGGVNGGHRGAGHREGRAIDVNIGTGNVEWNNPEMKTRFDSLQRELEAKYGDSIKILWGTVGHFDHMHIEFVKGFTRQMEALETIARSSADTVVSEVRDFEDLAPMTPVREVKELTLLSAEMVDPAVLQMERLIEVAEDTLDAYDALTSTIVEQLQQLGPEGAALSQAITGMSDFGRAALDAFKILESGADFADKFTAMSSAALSALSTIQGVLSSISQAKVEAVDKEIAAEQLRDGKSAESIAKLQSLEKKKDAIQRKSFETNKKVQMAQAIIATASGIAQALTMGPIIGPIMAAMIGALGAAQLAIIAGTSYQSTSAANTQSATMPSVLTIGKRGDSVDLAKNNPNAGGEIGYLRGAQGRGRSSADYAVIGSAYGGRTPRGYGNTAFVVGEHGPETITPETPITVRPANDNQNNQAPVHATFKISALDAKGVEELLHDQRGNIIGMLREAANANGQSFLEDVNTNVYTKPNVGRL